MPLLPTHSNGTNVVGTPVMIRMISLLLVCVSVGITGSVLGGVRAQTPKTPPQAEQTPKTPEKIPGKDRLTPTRDANTESGVYIPQDLNSALKELLHLLPPGTVAQMKRGPETDMILYHMGLGTWLRNNWGLWGGSRLAKWFNNRGIHHPEDMSGILLDSFWRSLHGKPLLLDAQIKHYQEFWKQSKKVPPFKNAAAVQRLDPEIDMVLSNIRELIADKKPNAALAQLEILKTILVKLSAAGPVSPAQIPIAVQPEPVAPTVPAVPVPDNRAPLDKLEIKAGSQTDEWDSLGFLHVKGTIFNNSDDLVRYVQVDVEGMNKEGTRVDKGMTNTTDLGPKQSWVFEIILTSKGVAYAGVPKISITPL